MGIKSNSTKNIGQKQRLPAGADFEKEWKANCALRKAGRGQLSWPLCWPHSCGTDLRRRLGGQLGGLRLGGLVAWCLVTQEPLRSSSGTPRELLRSSSGALQELPNSFSTYSQELPTSSLGTPQELLRTSSGAPQELLRILEGAKRQHLSSSSGCKSAIFEHPLKGKEATAELLLMAQSGNVSIS